MLFMRTNKDAKNFRLVTAPLADPSPAHWKNLVEHRPDVLLDESRSDPGREVAVIGSRLGAKWSGLPRSRRWCALHPPVLDLQALHASELHRIVGHDGQPA